MPLFKVRVSRKLDVTGVGIIEAETAEKAWEQAETFAANCKREEIFVWDYENSTCKSSYVYDIVDLEGEGEINQRLYLASEIVDKWPSWTRDALGRLPKKD